MSEAVGGDLPAAVPAAPELWQDPDSTFASGGGGAPSHPSPLTKFTRREDETDFQGFSIPNRQAVVARVARAEAHARAFLDHDAFGAG